MLRDMLNAKLILDRDLSEMLDEAADLLGSSVIKTGTNKYDAGNAIYEFLHFQDILFNIFKEKQMRFVGGTKNAIDLFDKENSNLTDKNAATRGLSLFVKRCLK